MREQLACLRGVRTRGNEEHAGDFVCRLVQRDAVLKRVDDAVRRLKADDFVQRGLLEMQIDQGAATRAMSHAAFAAQGRSAVVVSNATSACPSTSGGIR